MEAREDQAWLHRSRFNPHPVPGILRLAHGELSFSVDDDAPAEDAEWLEGRAVAFSHPLDDCAITWPVTGGGTMMVIDAPSRKWFISYDRPSSLPAVPLLQTVSMLSGRTLARQWKKALAAAEADAT